MRRTKNTAAIADKRVLHEETYQRNTVITFLLMTAMLLLALMFCTQPVYAANTSKHKSVKTSASTHKKKTAHATQKKSPTKKTRKKNQTRKHNPSTAANLHVLLNSSRTIESNLPAYMMKPNEQRLVNTIYQAVSSLRYSSYQLGGTRIDSERGVYVVDCSGYVDHIINTVFPRAYSSLVNWSGTEKPTSDDYYHYFSDLGSKSANYWNAVDDVGNLRPGDVLVFRNTSQSGYERGGHVMIVMDKPRMESDAYSVRVSDAAPSGHSKDTRPLHTSGIGIGTLLLKVNPNTSQPYAYAWKQGAPWKRNVTFAMARPHDLDFG